MNIKNDFPEYLIVNAKIVNENTIKNGAVLIKNEKIEKIFYEPEIPITDKNIKILDAKGKYLLPGIIDDQVHFRDPGLTHKADIFSESRAAVAGGITSFMEMPNTIPQTTTLNALEEKYKNAEKKSIANYAFYIGATNNNINELLKINPKQICGIKIFMGSSTGNMLVNDINILSGIFEKAETLIAVHCEDDNIINRNIDFFKKKYGENIPVKYHPEIRNEEACFSSSSLAVKLAKKYNARLHLLHLSTKKELSLLDSSTDYDNKRITSEVCVHHLWFNDSDYQKKGTLIKWNPAIKTEKDRKALVEALIDNTIDVVATDHAPHLLKEKQNSYFKAPSGGPLVQHSLLIMLELAHKKEVSIEKVVDKMCHTPAKIFGIEKRGFIKEGYWADIVLVDINNKWEVNKNNILYKCGWSPFEGYKFKSKVTHTFVNGTLVFENNKIIEKINSKSLIFNR